ncbi:MAG: DUF1501 domain-containing protein [Verrucomicrobia bacterium]|nr:DUF1501 domain-containing protein [Verrucomicrobiota bacterium]
MKLDRRQFLLGGSLGISSSIFGLSWLDQIALQQVAAADLDSTRQYDAAVIIYYEGGPSQMDSFDPKPGTPGDRYSGVPIPGMEDIYGNQVQVTKLVERFGRIDGSKGLHQEGLGTVRLGFIRSMHHGIPVHQFAQKFTTNFWQSPVGFDYPPAAPLMAHYFSGHAAATGLPGSVFIRGGTGRDANTMRNARVPLAMEVEGSSHGMDIMPEMLRTPQTANLSQRTKLAEIFGAAHRQGRKHADISSWNKSVQQAAELTLSKVAEKAFTIDKNNLLSAGNDSIYHGYKQRFTLASQLVKYGVPFVQLGIGGNDDGHFNNTKAVENIFGQLTDDLVREMVLSLESWCVEQNKRVLVLMMGEFGRTPHLVSKVAGHDTRGHWASGFTWALASINHPNFKSTAIGDTGPDGSHTLSEGPLIHPVRPSAVGGLLYQVMGFPPELSENHIQMLDGRIVAPVDLSFVKNNPDGAHIEGNTPWLMHQFGLA